jgi:hypothetical protein
VKPRCRACGRVRWNPADETRCPLSADRHHAWSLRFGYRPRLTTRGPGWWLAMLWYEYLQPAGVSLARTLRDRSRALRTRGSEAGPPRRPQNLTHPLQ